MVRESDKAAPSARAAAAASDERPASGGQRASTGRSGASNVSGVADVTDVSNIPAESSVSNVSDAQDAARPEHKSLDDWNKGAENILSRHFRWKRVSSVASRAWPFLAAAILIAAVALAILLPVPLEPFSRRNYVDENALQPGLTDVTYQYEHVSYADSVSARVLDLAKNGNAQERADYLMGELAAAGLDVYTQAYAYDVPSERDSPSGTNIYARYNAPRTDGREAMIIAASWESDHPTGGPDTLPYQPSNKRTVNVRGVASVVALAKHITSIRSWSKDIIFVISDGHLDGMSAWATRFFGAKHPHLVAEPVDGGGARVWNAVALDYPGDSFSSLMIRHEGLNGQLPNLDTINSVHHVVRNVAGKVGLGVGGASYEHTTDGAYGVDQVASWGVPHSVLETLEDRYIGWGGTRRFFASWTALWGQWRALLVGHPTGVHGVLLPYHVDAVTIYALPADGPFGFFYMVSVTESLARTFSNLIERLHHSQFFYLLLSIERFVQIGVYLIIPLALGALLTITGLRIWSRLAVRRDERRAALLDALVWQADDKLSSDGVRTVLGEPMSIRPTVAELERVIQACVPEEAKDAARRAFARLGRPVWAAIACIVAAHVGGIALFAIAAHTPLFCAAAGAKCTYFSMACGVSGIVTLSTVFAAALTYPAESLVALAATLHVFVLLQAGLITSVVATVNVAQATTFAAVCVIALYPLSATVSRDGARQWKALLYVVHGLVLMALAPPCAAALVDVIESQLGLPRTMASAIEQLVWDWHVLRSSTLPFFTVVCAPVMSEAAMAAFIYMRAHSFSSVDPSDVAHFSRLSEHWWDEGGEFALLHRMNRVRLEYMRTKIQEVRDWDAALADVLGAPVPPTPPAASFLRNLDILDVGSGGGLLCESAARLGARVTGVDASAENIKVATLHASKDPGIHVREEHETPTDGSLLYLHSTAEALRDSGCQYDVVTAMEVVEHVNEPAEFLRCLAALVRPGGHLFMSTMARTPLSYLLTIAMAEHILRLVTPGTHRHSQYINPGELVGFFRELGWIKSPDDLSRRPLLPDGTPLAPEPARVQFETRGTWYVPWTGKWELAAPAAYDTRGAGDSSGERLTEQCNYFFWIRRPMDI
ncbi:dolichyl-P-Man:Man5GlcNAc2-PP-dolichol alpha-1,3-mannosyltransferase [Malassezia cuniculi]|uniref:Ubiquinone biosynthesis O-methyltransferase, mitochondrial n=1 Tax=Malassezia cuniculi TaxID=948313 RepID=A0AAF0EQG2_9BASI|nr:dolichyl-P-Man:Man5GlcNAc2-PP-dolichol alpha-1,3-mannosyltransferase [Malassezia cuniculi]